MMAPKNQNAVVELIMKKLRIKDTITAEEGYHDAVRTIARKPYPAVEGMRNVQRLLKTQNPRIGEVNVEDLVDSRYIRKLDESGFLSRFMGNDQGLKQAVTLVRSIHQDWLFSGYRIHFLTNRRLFLMPSKPANSTD